MKDTDIRRHEGLVTESGHDLTLAVLIESVSDTAIVDVRPESVSPLRWRPAEGSRVVVYERVGPLHSDSTYTWVGFAPNIQNEAIVPAYLEPGRIHLVGEDGVLVLSLEDDADAVTLPDGADSATSIVRIGREDASEPLVLGGVWRKQMRDILDELVNTATALRDAANAIQSATWLVPPGTFTTPSGPVTGSSNATPPDLSSIVNAAQGVINAIETADTGLKDQLDDAYSTYAFTSRDPARQT